MAFSARLLYAALKNIIGMLWNPGADFWKELSAEKKNHQTEAISQNIWRHLYLKIGHFLYILLSSIYKNAIPHYHLLPCSPAFAVTIVSWDWQLVE